MFIGISIVMCGVSCEWVGNKKSMGLPLHATYVFAALNPCYS